MDPIRVALEIGKKRIFASALEWPGWARSGRDEAAALQSLLDYGSRYERAIAPARLGFRPPADLAAFTVTERLHGDATTDFGAPGAAPKFDSQPVDAAELRRLQSILKACWKTLAGAIEAARGKPLRKGPRGGGRELTAIFQHVADAHYSYLGSLGYRGARNSQHDIPQALDAIRTASAEALALSAEGKLPAVGPRGGARWPARYFVRRATWHILDHVWEIEDRVMAE